MTSEQLPSRSENEPRWLVEACSECGQQDGGESLRFHSEGCSRDGQSGDRLVEVAARSRLETFERGWATEREEVFLLAAELDRLVQDRELRMQGAFKLQDELTNLTERVRGALNVLGSAERCPANTCEGCDHDHSEAVTLLRLALAFEEGAQCEQCNGARYVPPAPDSTFTMDLCPLCGGKGTKADYDPLKDYFRSKK